MAQSDTLEPLRERLASRGETLSESAAETLAAYRDLLLTSNPKYSLVSKSDEPRIVSRHFVESADFLRWIPDEEIRVVDLGSGGGLPGLVIQILRPATRVALLEARTRKQDFLRHAVRTLRLQRASVGASVEELLGGSRGRAGTFERVVVRSVAALEEIAPLAAALLAGGGLLLAAKGSRAEEEIDRAEGRLVSLGLEWIEQRFDPLTTRDGKRIGLSTLVLRKKHDG